MNRMLHSLLLAGLFLSLIPAGFQSAIGQTFTAQEIKDLKSQAREIEIVKDRYGVPHVYAKTDAGAVFGMMYVQCEEFFEKVENTVISRLGRLAEVEGETSLYKDL